MIGCELSQQAAASDIYDVISCNCNGFNINPFEAPMCTHRVLLFTISYQTKTVITMILDTQKRSQVKRWRRQSPVKWNTDDPKLRNGELQTLCVDKVEKKDIGYGFVFFWYNIDVQEKMKRRRRREASSHLPDVFPEAIFATRSTPPPITKSLMRLLELKGFSCSSNCFCFCFRCNWCCWCCNINRSRSWKCVANARRSCSTADDMIALAVISVFVVDAAPLAIVAAAALAAASANNLLCCCWRSSSLNGMLLFICFGLLCADCVVIDDEDDRVVTGRCHCISAEHKTIGKFSIHTRFHLFMIVVSICISSYLMVSNFSTQFHVSGQTETRKTRKTETQIQK